MIGKDKYCSEEAEIPTITIQQSTIVNRNVGLIGPAGSIVSSTNDMAKWLAMILNKGIASNGRRILPKEAIECVFTSEILFDDVVTNLLGNKPQLGQRTSYGLGNWKGHQSGIEYIQHGGDLFGFHSTHALIRSLKSGFFFSKNHGKQLLEQSILENSINNILLTTISLQEACDFPFLENANSNTSFTKNKQNIPIYSEYENWAYGSISIKTIESALIQLSLNYRNAGRFNLLSFDNEMYIGIPRPRSGPPMPEMLFHFEEEENGKMNNLIAKTFEITDPPIFQRSLGPEPPVDNEKCID
ncbi:DgyrCDS14944 [Dimorphilus gyrociliatus]|uniref:DgyrCDS14944 n=1 Tax=Dimorphilus gyrociliatus TaxID=2664684 RepID=A0A7I8WFM3_9ANNE|nr:DgyrCDS14944 [Dimorphilus gyrociliatus]